MDKKYIEEELRVLYVALTRARERLFITGGAGSDTDTYMQKIKLMRSVRSPYQQRICGSFLSLILSSIQNTDAVISTAEDRSAEVTENGGTSTASAIDKTTADEKENASLTERLLERFRYEYPYSAHTTLPEKLSVSHLYPTVLDGSDDGEDAPGIQARAARDKHSILPDFYSGARENESALRGIATHTVLQFCDLENLGRQGVDAELSRLLRDGYITESELDRVRREEIEKFRVSPLLSEMKSAERLYREFRFNCRIPAVNFTLDEQRAKSLENTEVLVQGVIDCMIEDSYGNIRLIDYKTDRLSKEALSSEKLAAKIMTEKHGQQLFYYAKAIEYLTGKKCSRVAVYSTHSAKLYDIDVEAFDSQAK
jgi:ATP-dependent helicase/nuclease subunit A